MYRYTFCAVCCYNDCFCGAVYLLVDTGQIEKIGNNSRFKKNKKQQKGDLTKCQNKKKEAGC